jgi:hypothetical protein
VGVLDKELRDVGACLRLDAAAHHERVEQRAGILGRDLHDPFPPRDFRLAARIAGDTLRKRFEIRDAPLARHQSARPHSRYSSGTSNVGRFFGGLTMRTPKTPDARHPQIEIIGCAELRIGGSIDVRHRIDSSEYQDDGSPKMPGADRSVAGRTYLIDSPVADTLARCHASSGRATREGTAPSLCRSVSASESYSQWMQTQPVA